MVIAERSDPTAHGLNDAHTARLLHFAWRAVKCAKRVQFMDYILLEESSENNPFSDFLTNLDKVVLNVNFRDEIASQPNQLRPLKIPIFIRIHQLMHMFPKRPRPTKNKLQRRPLTDQLRRNRQQLAHSLIINQGSDIQDDLIAFLMGDPFRNYFSFVGVHLIALVPGC